MDTSESRLGETGGRLPVDACTAATVSSTLTNC